MEEDFVTYDLAVKLKEKGFDLETKEVYERNIIACRYEDYHKPTISKVLKWLREEKKMHIEIFLYNGSYSYFIKSITQICKDDLFHKCLNEDTVDEEYATYEQAVLAGIEYVIDNLI